MKTGLLFLITGIKLKLFIKQQKKDQMKKLLLVLSIGAFAACNGSGSATSSADSTAKAVDSMKMTADSTKTKMDSTMRTADSLKAKMDSTKK